MKYRKLLHQHQFVDIFFVSLFFSILFIYYFYINSRCTLWYKYKHSVPALFSNKNIFYLYPSPSLKNNCTLFSIIHLIESISKVPYYVNIKLLNMLKYIASFCSVGNDCYIERFTKLFSKGLQHNKNIHTFYIILQHLFIYFRT